MQIARGNYIISIEKPGYATMERNLSSGFWSHPMRGPKRLTLFDGGHVPGPEILLPALNEFLDQTVGTLRQ